MERNCRVIAEALQEKWIARSVPGIHLEGPYISPEDGPRGAHPKPHVRKPDLREFDKLMKAADGKILYITVAPEAEGAIPFIKAVTKQGTLAALGHHNASAEIIGQAVDAGARLSTHLGNGLASTIPRHANPLWPQLSEDRLYASFIPDLEHLPPAVLKTLIRAKGPQRTILTSDVVYLAGLKPGRYTLQESEVELLPSGRICLSGTEFLAGSSLLLLQGVVNAVQMTDLSLKEAYACVTSIPAKLFGVKHRFSLPEPGKRADFVVFDIRRTPPRWRAVIKAVFILGDRVT